MREANSLVTRMKSQGAKLRLKVNLPFEGQQEESPGLRVNGNVQERVLKLMLYIHIPGSRAGHMNSADPCRGKLGLWLRKWALRLLSEQGVKLFLENLQIC